MIYIGYGEKLVHQQKLNIFIATDTKYITKIIIRSAIRQLSHFVRHEILNYLNSRNSSLALHNFKKISVTFQFKTNPASKRI